MRGRGTCLFKQARFSALYGTFVHRKTSESLSLWDLILPSVGDAEVKADPMLVHCKNNSVNSTRMFVMIQR